MRKITLVLIILSVLSVLIAALMPAKKPPSSDDQPQQLQQQQAKLPAKAVPGPAAAIPFVFGLIAQRRRLRNQARR